VTKADLEEMSTLVAVAAVGEGQVDVAEPDQPIAPEDSH
jgi:hypothetical protein